MDTTAMPTREDVEAFVLNEARLLDEKRYEEWYGQFAEDGHYWIPLQHDQADADSHHSLMYEDRLLLRLRIDRLGHARAFSQQPASRSLHVLQQPAIERFDAVAGEYLVRTPCAYFESRGDQQVALAAVLWHSLVRDGSGALRIRLKRVNLLNCDAALPSIQLFL